MLFFIVRLVVIVIVFLVIIVLVIIAVSMPHVPKQPGQASGTKENGNLRALLKWLFSPLPLIILCFL